MKLAANGVEELSALAAFAEGLNARLARLEVELGSLRCAVLYDAADELEADRAAHRRQEHDGERIAKLEHRIGIEDAGERCAKLEARARRLEAMLDAWRTELEPRLEQALAPRDPAELAAALDVRCRQCGDVKLGPWGFYPSVPSGEPVMLCESCAEALQSQGDRIDPSSVPRT